MRQTVASKCTVAISLTQGQVCLVDAADADAVLRHKWHAWRGDERKSYYAVNGQLGRMHRWLLNAPRGVLVDHWNRNGLDNRRFNLRLATTSQNGMNSRQSTGASPYKGVGVASNGGWRARIKKDGVRRSLGYFKTALEAAFAYDAAAIIEFGEFAAPNFPERFKRY